MTAADADGGFQVQQSRSKGNSKRIYIGNLPQNDNIKAKLVDFLNQQANLGVVDGDVTIVRQGAAALVACADVNRAIATLNNVEFEGNKLAVQRERKKRPNNQSNKQPFRGWNRPSSIKNKPQANHKSAEVKKETPKEKSPISTETQDEKLFDNELELSQHLGSIVESELQAAKEDHANGDVVNAVIASTAAMTLLSSANAFGLEQHNDELKNDSAEQPPQIANSFADDLQADDTVDFLAQAKKPLSELLADYGEQDLDFQKVVPTTIPTEPTRKENTRQDYNNRLTLQGKAPIHVEVTSFGYIHGVPSEVRSGGWSYAHPLSPMDCRDLPQVPQYMARQDGLSPAVKRSLLNARDQDDEAKRDNCVRECANELGNQMFGALQEAIESGGHGHASPLRMTVYAGSESGRHRSVVVCELAATALRKLLRSNKDNRITQPVSVGTRHRDIERRQQQREMERRPKQSKQTELDGEW